MNPSGFFLPGLIRAAIQKEIVMNGYVCFYRGKRTEVEANTSFEAQEKAAKFFKAKKSYEVTVVLAEIKGETVVHTPDF